MGKLTSIYLTTEEERHLQRFCEENNCTPHSVLKAGLHLLLDESREEPQSEEKTPQSREKPEPQPSNLHKILKLLKQESKHARSKP